jgi:hypothetical protein
MVARSTATQHSLCVPVAGRWRLGERKNVRFSRPLTSHPTSIEFVLLGGWGVASCNIQVQLCCHWVLSANCFSILDICTHMQFRLGWNGNCDMTLVRYGTVLYVVWGSHGGDWRMLSSGILRRVALVRTGVSEERIASMIRVTRIGKLGTLAVTCNRNTMTWHTMWGMKH